MRESRFTVYVDDEVLGLLRKECGTEKALSVVAYEILRRSLLKRAKRRKGTVR